MFVTCRYYNSWIETSDDAAQSDTSSSFSSTPKTSESEKKVSLPQGFRKNSLDLTDDIEKFAPQVAETSTDFSISYEVRAVLQIRRCNKDNLGIIRHISP